jgi:hypothetical protein
MIFVSRIGAAPIGAAPIGAAPIGPPPKPSCSRRSRRGIRVVKSFTFVKRVCVIGVLRGTGGGCITGVGGAI